MKLPKAIGLTLYALCRVNKTYPRQLCVCVCADFDFSTAKWISEICLLNTLTYIFTDVQYVFDFDLIKICK